MREWELTLLLMSTWEFGVIGKEGLVAPECFLGRPGLSHVLEVKERSKINCETSLVVTYQRCWFSGSNLHFIHFYFYTAKSETTSLTLPRRRVGVGGVAGCGRCGVTVVVKTIKSKIHPRDWHQCLTWYWRWFLGNKCSLVVWKSMLRKQIIYISVLFNHIYHSFVGKCFFQSFIKDNTAVIISDKISN